MLSQYHNKSISQNNQKILKLIPLIKKRMNNNYPLLTKTIFILTLSYQYIIDNTLPLKKVNNHVHHVQLSYLDPLP